MTIEYISFSAWKDWNTCPYKFKITRIDKVRLFQGNEYSTFGTAVHDTSEKLVLLEQKRKQKELTKEEHAFDPKKFFKDRFKEELSLLGEKNTKVTDELVKEMKLQGEELVQLILPSLEEYFGSYELFEAEYELRQPVDNHINFDFYGFVDLIVKTSDGKYHIIDWKTCSWGWDMKKRTSKEYTYQLTYYKHFLSKQLKIEPKMIETHFGLLKRTAKKNKVEIFRVTSGERKVNNALNILDKCVTNIEKKNFVKNRLSCSQCEFNKTIYCK